MDNFNKPRSTPRSQPPARHEEQCRSFVRMARFLSLAGCRLYLEWLARN
jgi:hypothetical protein